MARLASGTRVDRFEIKSVISTGAAGTVYLARDTNPTASRIVALKIFDTELDPATLRSRFGPQADALIALRHANLVTISEWGDFRGAPYLVMEYVSGETVDEKLKRHAALSLPDKLKLLIELCAAIAHAHVAGVVHRDLHPVNLIVEHTGRLRVVGFGLSVPQESGVRVAEVEVTQIHVRGGRPGYMAPEQYEGTAPDARGDVFAIGSICYELLAGREAFSGTSARQIEQKVLQADPERLTGRVAGVDAELEAVVFKALQKDPAKRYQNAGEVERALAPIGRRLGVSDAPRLAPTPGAGRKSSRADAAYQRALAAAHEGAAEAARRYCLETLAEDPRHEGARVFLQRHDPARRPDPFGGTLRGGGTMRGSIEDAAVEPTIVSSRLDVMSGAHSGKMAAPPELEQTMVSAPGPRLGGSADRSQARASKPERKETRRPAGRWNSPVPPLILAAAALVIVMGGVLGIVFWGMSRPQGEMRVLTIAKPSNGTIVGDDINCGTQGSLCTARIPAGDLIALELRPDDGFSPERYTGDCAQTGRVRMSSDRTCGATFIANAAKAGPGTATGQPQTLTVFATEGGVVRIGDADCRIVRGGCSKQFRAGELVDLEVLADPGYTFEKFTGACDADGRVTMTVPQTCGASFVRNGMAIASGGAAQSGAAQSGAAQGISRPPQVPAGASNQGQSVGGRAAPLGGVQTPPSGATQPATVGGGGATATAPGGAATPPGAATTPPAGANTAGIPPAAGAGAGAETPGVPPPPPGSTGTGQAPPPPEVKAPDVEAKEQILGVMQEYRKAYEALNFGAIKRVYPKAAEFSFKEYTKIKFDYSGEPKVDLDLKSNTAKVEVGINQTFVKRGATKAEQGGFKTLNVDLTRVNAENRWVIERVTYGK
jgi:tRNA A-37 threonylcarbamoyl transferase component Bud32